MISKIKLEIRKVLIIFVRFLVQLIKSLEKNNCIYFYGPTGENGYLSNFSCDSIVIDAVVYQNVEVFYQCSKFFDVEIREKFPRLDLLPLRNQLLEEILNIFEVIGSLLRSK